MKQLTEEQKQAYLKSKAEHEERMKTDPKYRATWERRHQDFLKLGKPLMGCVIEDEE